MADDYTSNLNITKLEVGQRDDTWGTGLNNEVIELLEDALTEEVSLTLTSSNVTLTTTQGGENQARKLFLDCSGTLTANVQVIIPNVNKFYFARNATSGAFTVTIKTAGGAGYIIDQGETACLYCDGADNVFLLSTPSFSTTAAARSEIGAQQDVITTRGDIIRGSSSGVAQRLALGTVGQVLTSDGTDISWGATSVLRGYIDGLILSNNTTDSNNDIDISPGVATDDGSAAYLTLSSALTKRLDAGWAVGNNQGGLDTGAAAVNTWYHVWIIRRTDTGIVDILFSTSATNPNMPASYTQKRRIGAFRTETGATTIRPFLQFNDTFWFKSSIDDIDVSNQSSAAVLRTLTVPLGISVTAIINLSIINASTATNVFLRHPDVSDDTSSSVPPRLTLRCLAGVSSNVGNIYVPTNTSSQIESKADQSNTTIRIVTNGWVDPRGKNA